MCENKPDGSIAVKDPTSRRIFRIKTVATPKEGEAELEKKAEQVERKTREDAEKAADERKAAEDLLKQKKVEDKRLKTKGDYSYFAFVFDSLVYKIKSSLLSAMGHSEYKEESWGFEALCWYLRFLPMIEMTVK